MIKIITPKFVRKRFIKFGLINAMFEYILKFRFTDFDYNSRSSRVRGDNIPNEMQFS